LIELNMHYMLAIVGILIALAGCATSPTPPESARPVPASRIHAPGMLGFGAAQGQLVVTRDTGFSGSGCSIRIHLDAAPVADFRPGETLTVGVEPGEHVISAKAVEAICPGTVSEAAVKIESGKSKRYRIAINPSMDLVLQPTAF
jgi:hypothetical protein